ncbi:VCBS repeat-containing protein [Phorcysia thermohydrogeniphila]|uniref:VCBS repeat protein n=1 Tax=Phorcysia thermohydrogeniphila TaxID=936138 RepID=A0A4R1GCL0_9BACT|nr:VCBS repeat-containing protein [Phorcysia thermohydrogeniphila]TCK03429.1 hypothetical protein CLV27_1507 [Phorcysia thermohydrogeniphila]
MRKALLLAGILLTSCSLSPFGNKEPQVYPTYAPKEKTQESRLGLKGVENVLFYMKKEFSPVEGEIVLNSYDGFIIDLGKKNGISEGDRFISESGAVLKVKEVRNDYSVALPTIGNPLVGEKVKKFSFNKALFIDFTGEKGKELLSKLKEEVKTLNLAPYEEGEKFKKLFGLKFPSDFRRKVPAEKLLGYDGYLVVSERGVEVYDNTKKLVKLFPWEGAPASSFQVGISSGYKVVLDLKSHATSLFAGNIDKTPQKELVVATENDIRVYHVNTYGVSEVYRFKNPFPGSYLFHISPVDLDRDGKLELVIDGFYQETKSVSSGVFTVKNGKLRKLAKSNLILSGFDTDGDGVNETLYGQKVSSELDKFFGKDVWIVELKGNKLVKGKKVSVPPEFQVTSAQSFKVGSKTLFAYYDLDYFFNVSDGSQILWRSPIQIGASPNSIYWYVDDTLVSYYITPKPKPVDVNGDGEEEVLFSQNKNAAPGILRNIYTFDGGRVLLLYRKGTTFDWEEATVPIYKLGGLEEFDYIPEYDLLVAVFTESGIFKRPKSKLLFVSPRF